MNENMLNPSASPSCESCFYVMPSYTSTTGLRCGLKYFHASVLMRKFQRMEHYPEVKPNNACESWALKNLDNTSSASE